MKKNNIYNNKEIILKIIGLFLFIIAFLLLNSTRILEIENKIYENIQSQIYKENTSITKEEIIDFDIELDIIDENYIPSNENPTTEVTPKPQTPNYIAFLEIPKINLKQGLLSPTSYYNNVDYHVQILSISKFPDVVGGNFILAAHSGTSYLAYFKDLYKLQIGDNALIYYNGNLYKYEITNIYNQLKDGAINIYRNHEVTTLTLITCTKDDKNNQTVYIAELTGVQTY